MTKDKALKMALEALENAEYGDYGNKELNKAITAIKKALAQPKQEEIKGVVMRCADYDIALPVIDIREGRVLVGQVSIPPKPKEPEQEPVAWMDDYNACKCSDNETRCFSDRVFRMMQKYTAPPQRTWTGLTDEEHIALHDKFVDTDCYGLLIDATEAKLKEKNYHE